MEEVKSLLFHSDRSEDFLESSKLNQVVQLMGKDDKSEDTDLPECKGPYRIVEILGKGGMGSVYIADQLMPIQRKVALKVINLGMSGEEFFNRFRYERQTLAMMNHVNIAHVFDAGRTIDGRPFFTMEFVSGESITDYCDSKRLTIRERLKLFLQVCDGVAHAHRKGIIHRDLKPSNILVTVDEDQPVPKIIDFGIAKVMDLDQAENRQTTIFGTVVGTPAYMSPEQADCQDVDTTTDVYAMGVVLYELIVGFLPFEAEVYRKTSITEVLKVILEMEPPTLVERFSNLDGKNLSVAEKRRILPKAMAKELKGDLDAVVMKAIDKHRNQRYGSIAEMADDIQRFLQDKPVEAGAHNTLYSMRKFVRRHKKGAIVFFVIALALLSGILGSTFGLIRAQKAEKAAEREAEYARENKEFLQGILASATPFYHRRGQIDITGLLKNAEERLQDASLNPAEEAQLRSTLAKTYLDWGGYEKALNHLQLALAIWDNIREPLHPDTQYTHFLLGHVLLRLEETERAEEIAREVLKVQVNSYGENHKKSLRTKRLLADIFASTERFSQARNLYRDILERQQSAQGERDPEVLVSMNLLATNLVQLGQYDEAEELYRETLRIREEQLGRQNPYTLGSMHGLARVLYRQGDFDDAKSLAMESYKLHVDVFGKDSPLTAQVLNNLNLILMALGEVEDEEATRRQLIEERRETFGKEDKRTLRVMNNYANYLMKTERFAEAQRWKMEELEIWRRVYPNHHETLVSSITLGQLYLKSQEFEKAESFLRDLAEKLRNKADLDPSYLILTEGLIGACSCETGQFSRGEAILFEAYGKLKDRDSLYSPLLYAALVDCYIKWEKPERIEAIQK